MDMDVSSTPELLRQHGGFVCNLARALLADPDQAEDVAQEALTRWVTHPPRDASRPRAWLTTVVRRLAANTRREEWRRAQHEEQAATAEEAPSALEASEQAELVQRVVAAVMELETAQRDTILSLYFRGLTVRELAEQSATSEDTVRTRERRALEKLRQKLDRGFGRRESWALGLGMLAVRSLAPAPAAAGTGGASGPLAAWVGVAGVLALASTAAVFWLTASEEGSTRGETAQETSALAELQAGTQENGSASAQSDTRTPVSASLAPVASRGDSGGSSSAFTSAVAEIRGTFLLEGGAPAAHIPWSVIGWEGNEERVIDEGLPDDWVDLQGETAADGSFSASFAPPKAFQFAFDAKAPGHAQVSWRWGTIEPGRVLDLGTVTLARGATVTGRLVDAAGAPILGPEWKVDVNSRGLGGGEGRDDMFVTAEVDPATGEFLAEDVMPGSNELHAHHPVAGSVLGPRVVAVAGATLTADIVYAGPDVARRITVSPGCRPMYVFDPSGENIHLLAPDGSTRTAQQIVGSAQGHSFDDLAPGAYTVTIDDPRFRPWSQIGVLPGTELRPRLEPCSEVVVAAVDAEGQPVALDQLTVELHDGHLVPSAILVYDGSVPFAGSVRLVPGDYTLHGRAGELEAAAYVAALDFDETRALTLSFGAGPMLRGRVVSAGGAAVGGVQVLLLRPAQQNDSSASPIQPPNMSTGNPELYRKQLDAVESEADGSYAFRISRGGDYVVYAESANGLCAASSIQSLADGDSRAGIELAFAPGGVVSGTVRAPGGTSCAGLRLWIGPELVVGPAWHRQLLAMEEKARTLGADGSFAFEDLPAGMTQAVLLLPGDAHPTANGHGGTWNRIDLDRFELGAGQTLVRDLEATLPGTFTLEVRVNGVPAIGSGFALEHPYETPNRPSLNAVLDGSGGYGPAQLFPGPWSVRVNDAPGMTPVPIEVTAGGETHNVVDVIVATGSLRVLDAAGAGLAGRTVSVFYTPGGSHAVSCARATADAQGQASLTLAPGSYLLRLDAPSGRPIPFLGPEDVTVPLTWTPQGPTTAEIRF
jgi:RNA polymerase sigma-70 factor, ECF subfamily